MIPPEVLDRRFGRSTQAGGSSPALQVPYESWLLQDARFEPVFGQTFDAVGPQEAAQFRQAGGGCPSPRNERGQAVVDNMLFARAFDERYRPRYSEGIARIREAQTQAAAAVNLLKGLQADENGARQFQATVPEVERLGAFLDQEKRAALQQGLRETFAKLVQPQQARRVQDVVASARGYEGLLALVALQQELASYAPLAGSAVGVSPELRARQVSLAQELVAAERGRIDALGTGIVNLERGVQWHQEYRSRYAARLTPTVPELSGMLSYFEERRGVALEAAEKDLTGRINQVQSEAELQQLIAKYIPLEFDQRHRSGTALLTSVAAKRDDMHKRSVLGQGAQPPAATLAQSKGNVPNTGEPSESEMYDAFNERLEAANAQARSVAERCNNRQFQGDSLLAMQCLQFGLGVGVTKGAQGVLAPEFKVSRFEKLGCEKAQGEAGYRCDYVAGMAGNVNLPPSMGAMVRSGSMTQARFVRRGGGWLLIPDQKNER